MSNIFQLGEYTLSSGAKSKFKIECDSLTTNDIAALADMIRTMVGPFTSVEGVPRGGIALASRLKIYEGLNGPHLIVDDVLTTGGSMERIRGTHTGQGPAGRPGIIGAVVFARGQCPLWVKALFQMPECFWVKPRQRGV